MTTLPGQMKAWQISTDGSGALQQSVLPLPRPAAGEVLLRVRYAGINRADVFQRAGTYPAPVESNMIPGLEVSGETMEGEKVCALLSGGGYAEYCVAPAAQILPIPHGLTLEQAASLPEAYATSWLALVETAQLKAGETLLVHGGSSGIGTAAIQLARSLGASVIATAGTEEKCAACQALGAKAINYKGEDFLERTKTLTTGRGVDVILDMVGGSYAERNLRALSVRGRLVTIALLGGAEATVPLGGFLMKNLSWHALTLRSRRPEEKAKTLRQMQKTVWPLLESGEILPVIDSTYPIAEVEKAHARMQESLHIGKIILSM